MPLERQQGSLTYPVKGGRRREGPCRGELWRTGRFTADRKANSLQLGHHKTESKNGGMHKRVAISRKKQKQAPPQQGAPSRNSKKKLEKRWGHSEDHGLLEPYSQGQGKPWLGGPSPAQEVSPVQKRITRVEGGGRIKRKAPPEEIRQNESPRGNISDNTGIIQRRFRSTAPTEKEKENRRRKATAWRGKGLKERSKLGIGKTNDIQSSIHYIYN